MKKNTKISKKNLTIGMIGTLVFISALGATIGVVFNSTSTSNTTSNDVKIESQSSENNELEEGVKNSKMLGSLLKYKENELVFDEFNVTNNIKKVLVDAISTTNTFKFNRYKKDEINLDVKYAIKEDKKLYVKCHYNFKNNLNDTYESFCILIK